MAIVDQRTREGYGEHVGELGRGVADTAGAAMGLATAPGCALLGR